MCKHDVLIHISITSHRYLLLLCEHLKCLREKKCLRKFQVYNTVQLTMVTMLYIRSPKFIHFAAETVKIW